MGVFGARPTKKKTSKVSPFTQKMGLIYRCNKCNERKEYKRQTDNAKCPKCGARMSYSHVDHHYR